MGVDASVMALSDSNGSSANEGSLDLQRVPDVRNDHFLLSGVGWNKMADAGPSPRSRGIQWSCGERMVLDVAAAGDGSLWG